MPFTTPSRTGSRPGPRRRSLLAAATGAALLTGCSQSGSDTAGKRPKAAAQARERAARESAELVERY
ncbi:hypothetical protein P8605_43710, partial [Streptomyces sp. T-3]|nr:hypothetical protein [Streptomyces sp. T-3]